MNTNKTILVVLVLTFSLMMLLGCTTPVMTDKESFSKLTQLQQKYFVVNGYSSNLTTMNDYISQLALLRAKSGGESAKVIETELYSAEAFYYLNKTIVDSAPLNSKQIKCSSNEVQNVISSITLAFDSSSKAVALINSLNSTQQSYLRVNQSEMILGQQEEINQIKKFFEEKC